MNDFSINSVCHGLHEGEFETLPAATRRKLVKLMARISEASYRRGFQQGVVLNNAAPETIPPDLADWRYRQSLAKSIGGDGWKGMNDSIERLFCEYRVLTDVGLRQIRGRHHDA